MFDGNEHPVHRERLKFGEHAAYKVTRICGSWAFIITILVYIAIWASLNLYGWIRHWDPYPFILLNLTLSCMAALQAPIILMGQNLEANRDRRRAEYDYTVDKKAEREIRDLQKDMGILKTAIEKHQYRDIMDHLKDIKLIMSKCKSNLDLKKK